MLTTHPQETSQPQVHWETIDCPLCCANAEGELLSLSGDYGDYRLVKCRVCNMSYLNPRPDRESIGLFYPDEYEPYAAPSSPNKDPFQRVSHYFRSLVLAQHYGYPPFHRSLPERLLGNLAKPCFGLDPNSMTSVPFHGRGKLLDFGCGSGWFAYRMRERGWDVEGMDFNAYAARQVRKRYGIKVHVGSLPHPDIADQSYDMISMGGVLEHVHDPKEIISAAFRALRPKGRLLILVPNLAGWGFRYFGRDWWGLDLPRHLLHFTPTTLSRLMEDCGLQVCNLRTIVRTGWLRRSLKIAEQRKSEVSQRLVSRVSRIRVFSSFLARWTGWKDQADCIRLIAERPEAA